MAPLLFVGLVLGDIAPPPPPLAQCRTNDDCIISTFAGCCGSCCPRQPYAVSKLEAKHSTDRCAAVDCATPNCKAVRCAAAEPATDFEAVCVERRCLATKKRAPVEPDDEGTCKVDSDCTAVLAQPPAGDPCHASACGCCPTYLATPVKRVEPVPLRGPPKSEPTRQKDSPFGLSTGQPPPACAPCPAPAPRLSRCAQGHCVTAPIPRPHTVGRR